MNETTQQEVQENQATTQVPGNQPDELNSVQGFAKFMDDGGVFMWIILGMWLFGVIISLERFKNLFKSDIDGTSLMNEVKKSVLTNDVQTAIQNCSTNKSVLASVLRNG